MHRATTLGELRAAGYTSRTVKDEIRANLVAALAEGRTPFPGIVGLDDTVLPLLESALLAGHDLVLLGERGQGKTRLMRTLVHLLDEVVPVVEGCEINDDPLAPVCGRCRRLHGELGDDLPVAWWAREDRYVEKLATPDTSVGDLVGDVDPVKVAEGRTLGDPETVHYGLLPRTNRGIFGINELPDLAERIQVGLLNVLEERDVQIRGYKIRLPLDVVLMASANPEDYTNRGRLITPLKDRFGSQIRTHYPLEVETEIAIMVQEAVPLDVETPDGPIEVSVPDHLREIVATFSHLARASNQVNQRSGVSVRLSVSNYEALQANALRRGLKAGERSIVARVDDLDALPASSQGKIEIESLEDGREGMILDTLIKGAVLTVFKERVDPAHTRAVVDAFEEGAVAHTGEDVSSADLARLVGEVEALREPVHALTGGDESPGALAAAVEFVLEGLHLSKRLNKDAAGPSATYRGRV